MEQENLFYSGTSGLVVPVPKHSFPPGFEDKSRLQYYAHLFNSIEINSSFYKLPRAVTIQKWADSVPEHFSFTFKLWREITHNKGLIYDPQNIDLFLQAIAPALGKRGSLLIQFPPSIKIDKFPQVQQLLTDVKQANAEHGWDVAIEFRDRSWYQEEVYEMLNEIQIPMVIHDKAASNSPMEEIESACMYIRFHGPEGNYRGSYEDDLLYEYAQYIKAWMEDGKKVYCYFNNTMGAAVHNLATINKYIKEE